MVGRVLCCSFKPIVERSPRWAKVYTFRADDPEFVNKDDIADDSKLVVAIRDELEKAHVIVGHNSKLFDRKFLNARLLKAGERPKQSQFHVDTMWTIRSHVKASSKLDNIQKHLGLEEAKTPLDWDTWMRGSAFDTQAMDQIVKHCEQDVKVLEGAYWRLLDYNRMLRRD
jgi:DNA polymerase III epsilon subunit-like protein